MGRGVSQPHFRSSQAIRSQPQHGTLRIVSGPTLCLTGRAAVSQNPQRSTRHDQIRRPSTYSIEQRAPERTDTKGRCDISMGSGCESGGVRGTY